MGRGFSLCLGLSLAVGSTDFESVLARLRFPVVDVLTPGVDAELGGELGIVPGLAAIG
jgi:hypothetical protein